MLTISGVRCDPFPPFANDALKSHGYPLTGWSTYHIQSTGDLINITAKHNKHGILHIQGQAGGACQVILNRQVLFSTTELSDLNSSISEDPNDDLPATTSELVDIIKAQRWFALGLTVFLGFMLLRACARGL